MKKIIFAVFAVVVIMGAVYFSTLTPVGFISKSIYYSMSPTHLKLVMGKPDEIYGGLDGYQSYSYEVEYEDVKGNCTFGFYNKNLISVSFFSDEGACDKDKAKEIAEKIKKKYRSRNGFHEEERESENSYLTSFGETDGAVGSQVDIEFYQYCKNQLSISGERVE